MNYIKLLVLAIVAVVFAGCGPSANEARGAYLLILGEQKHVGARVLVDGKEVERISSKLSAGPSAGLQLTIGTHVVEVEQNGKTILKESYTVNKETGELYAVIAKDK